MDIYQALINDHEALRPLLDQLVTASEMDADTDYLLDRIENLLIPHSRAEEAVFYNSLREIDAGKELVAHSYAEHMKAEAVLRTLQGLEKLNIEWDAAAKKLREGLLHHMAEEEGEIFPKARQMFFEIEAQQMVPAFEEAKRVAEQQGDLKNTLDMIGNMLPERLRGHHKDQDMHV